MKKAKLPLVLLCAGFLASAAMAKPASPFPVTQKQSDGTSLSYYNRGDEFYSYKESADGYLLIAGRHGDLYYAGKDGKASSFKAHDAALRSSQERSFLNGLNEDSAKANYYQIAPKRERRSYGTPMYERVNGVNVPKKPSAGTWSLGEKTFLMILVNHSGATWKHTRAEYDSLLNQTGYSKNEHYGSVRDYYIQQSGGLFKPTFKVIGPYTYNGSPAGNDQAVMQAMLDSAKAHGDVTSLSGFAHNTEYDGASHPFVGLVLAGTQAQSGVNSIYMGWRMDASMGSDVVGRYVYIPELGDNNSTELDGMGTFTHEFGHVLGLPDLYQTSTANGTKRTPGGYDVMDVGCYNNWTSSGVYGTHVPNMSSMEREWLGWHTPTELASSTSGVFTIPSYDANNFAYSITTKNDADQWFVLENRQQTKWDSSLPNHGLLIWHIDYNQNLWDANGVNNNTQYVDIEEADTTNEAYYTYPGTGNVTTFSNFIDWAGTSAYANITSIVESNGYICFAVGGATISQCPAADYNSSSSSVASSSSVMSSSSAKSSSSVALSSSAKSSSSVAFSSSAKSSSSVAFSSSAVSSSSAASSSSMQVTVKDIALTASLPVSSDYTPVQVSLNPDEVAGAFGIASSQIAGLYGSGVTYYGVNADGSLNATSTASDPGHWFDAEGNTVSYSSGTAALYSELDLTNMVAKVGNYPDKVTSGNVYTIRQILAYNNVQVKFTIAVTVTDSGTEKFVNDITGKASIFANSELALSGYAMQALNTLRASLAVYDIKGNKVATLRSGMTRLTLPKSGIYHAVLRVNGKNISQETFSFVK